MAFQYRGVRRADVAIWAVIAAAAIVVYSCTIFGAFRFDWRGFSKVIVGAAVLLAAGQFYLRFRKDPRAAAALTGTAQLALFAVLGASLSYVAASTNLPLWDDTFAAWDRALGLQWADWLAAMNAHPTLHTACFLAYSSFPLQATAVILALAATGRLTRLRVFLLSFMVTTIVTIAISAVMPAQGVWGYLQLSATD